MASRVRVDTSDLRRVFGSLSALESDSASGLGPLWRVASIAQGVEISGHVGGCECAATIQGEGSGAFNLRVPAGLLSRLVREVSDREISFVPTPAGLELETSTTRFRVWSVHDDFARSRSIPTGYDVGSSAPRVDAGILAKAVRVAATAASDADYFGVAAVQIALSLAGVLRVSATDHFALSDIVLAGGDTSDLHDEELAWRVSSGSRHLRFATRFLGGRGQEISIELGSDYLDLVSDSGRVRLPTIEFVVPGRRDDTPRTNRFRVRRQKLGVALDAVSLLTPGTAASMTERMVVTLTPSGALLVVSGGTTDVGDVQTSVALESPLEAEPFRVRRVVLERWLRAVDTEFVDVNWEEGTFARYWEAATEQWSARLVLATMK